MLSVSMAAVPNLKSESWTYLILLVTGNHSTTRVLDYTGTEIFNWYTEGNTGDSLKYDS